MSRIIYLISILNKASNISIFFMIVSIAALFFGGLFYLDYIGALQDYEEKLLKRFLMISGISLVISLAAVVFIPSKEEMYMMALTKDYEAEDVYKMTKDEIKESVDYIFEKIEDVKEWGYEQTDEKEIRTKPRA